jgi:hypothetical protein
LVTPSYTDDVTYLFSHTFLCPPPSTSQRPLASEETRDAVYRSLLSLSPLSSTHERQLQRRGFSNLSDDVALCTLYDARGNGAEYRQWLVAKVLEKTGFSSEVVAGVPGFYLDEQGEVRLKGSAGMLIPTYNCRRQIIGMQIRRDTVKSDQPRYLWLSSANMGGASGGAPVGFLPKSATCDVVDILEGFFKALSLSQQGIESKGFLYMPGVGMLSGLLRRLDELEQLSGSIQKARIWFDADSYTNPNVLRSLKNLLEALTARGIVVEVKGWDLARGKGIDDYLQGGGRLEDVQRMDVEGILRNGRLRKHSAHLRSSTKNARGYHTPLMPDTSVLFDPQPAEPTQEGLYQKTEEAMREALASLIGTLYCHDGATGTGKTHSFTKLATAGTVYAAPNYKVLLEVEQRLKDAGKRYLTLFGRGDAPSEGANEQERALRERLWDEAGCDNLSQAKRLGEKGFFPCHGCPFYKPNQEEGGCRYWQQRKKALANPSGYILLTLAQTLSNNSDLVKQLGEQMSLDGSGGITTLAFDDIPNLIEILARPVRLTLDETAIWEHHVTLAEEKYQDIQRLAPYRRLVEEIHAVIADPKRGLGSLYEAGKRAKDAFDIEDKHFRLLEPVGEELPLNQLESLASWLASEKYLWFEGFGKERSLCFLSPSPLVPMMSKTRVVVLDATPNPLLLAWLAQALGMTYKQSSLPRQRQNLIQIADKLFTGEQLAHPVVQGLRSLVSAKNGLRMAKKALADGDPYFGGSDRGVDCFNGAPMTVLEGHHSMSFEQAQNQAQVWKAFASYRQHTPPLADAPKQPEKALRRFGDAWRPWEREMHQLTEPLAEVLRRHHYSSTVLQASSRDRAPSHPKFILSGEPLEINGELVPVSLWTTDELAAFLRNQGVEVADYKKKATAKLVTLNEQRRAERAARVEEAARELLSLGYLPSCSEIRTLLGGKNSIRLDFAQDVEAALFEMIEIEQNQEFVSKTTGGTHTTVKEETSLCVPPRFLDVSVQKQSKPDECTPLARAVCTPEQKSSLQKREVEEPERASLPPVLTEHQMGMWMHEEGLAETKELGKEAIEEPPLLSTLSLATPQSPSIEETSTLFGDPAPDGDLEDRDQEIGSQIEDRDQEIGSQIEDREIGSQIEDREIGSQIEDREIGSQIEDRDQEIGSRECVLVGYEDGKSGVSRPRTREEKKRDDFKDVADEMENDPALHSPLPLGEEQANSPPRRRAGVESGQGREVWSWWRWLGGVGAWREWQERPSEATWSILRAILVELHTHLPDYPPDQMLRLLEVALE